MKTNEMTINELEAQQICFAIENEIESIMRNPNNSLDWLLYKSQELLPIYVKFRKIMEG